MPTPCLSTQLFCVFHTSQCGGSIEKAVLWTTEARERETDRNTEWKFETNLHNPDVCACMTKVTDIWAKL